MKREAPSQLGPIVMLNIRATPPFSAIFYFLCLLLMAYNNMNLVQHNIAHYV